MADRTPSKLERKQITVITVGQPQEKGDKGNKKLAFSAKEVTGQTLEFSTWHASIFEYIKPQAVLDCDIQYGSHEYNGQTYQDREIKQLYINGKPMVQQKSFGSGGFQKRTDWPEPLAATPAASKPSQPLAKPPTPPAAKAAEAPAKDPNDPDGLFAKEPVVVTAAKAEGATVIPIPEQLPQNNLTCLLRLANEHFGLQPEAVAAEANCARSKDIKDFQGTWMAICGARK